MKKILYCISPNGALINKTIYNEVQLGSAIVEGILNKGGFDITSIDLNALLNNYRGNSPLLTQDDFAILSNPYLTKLYMGMELDQFNYDSKISEVLKWIIEAISPCDYSWIAFSLAHVRSENFHQETVTFNFTWLLSRSLKELTGAKIIWGGAVFDHFTTQTRREYFKYLSIKDVDCIYLGEADSSLLKILKQTFKSRKVRIIGSKKLITLWNVVVDVLSQIKPVHLLINEYRKFKKSRQHPLQQQYLEKLKLIPSFNMKNKEQYEINIEKIFKVGKFLKLQNGISSEANIMIHPYKFMKGCLNNCAFCHHGASGFTVLPPQDAVDQIEQILNKNPKVKYFRFINSQINFSNKYALSFANEIIRRKIKIYFTDSADLRNPSDEVFEALRKAGCIKLWVGAESLSPRVLKYIGKNLSVDEIYKGIDMIHRNGIWLGVNMITGFPFEEDQDHEHNVAFMKTTQDKINVWAIHTFYYYKFSRFYIYNSFYNLLPGKVYYPGGSAYAYAEKGARDAKQIKDDALNRYQDLWSLIPPYYNTVAENDWLLFYCYGHLFYTKKQTVDFINDYYKAAKHEKGFLETLV